MFKTVTIIVLMLCISLSNQLVLPDIGYKLSGTNNVQVEIEDNVVQYIPLGWTGNLDCPAVEKAKSFGLDTQFVHWKYVRKTIQTNDEQNTANETYSLGKVTMDDNNMIVRCSLKSTTGFATNIRIVVQNCILQTEKVSYNLHDPCQYGKCTVNENDKLVCLCFKQYTGAYCDIPKKFGFIHTLLPFFLPVLFLVAVGQLVMCFRWNGSSKSKKQMMQINRHSVPVDRQLIKHQSLFRADYYISKDAKKDSDKQSEGSNISPRKSKRPKQSMRTPLPKYEKTDVDKAELKPLKLLEPGVKSKERTLKNLDKKKTEKTQSSRKKTEKRKEKSAEKHKKEKTASRRGKQKREKTTSRKKQKDSGNKREEPEKREKEVESTQNASNVEREKNSNDEP